MRAVAALLLLTASVPARADRAERADAVVRSLPLLDGPVGAPGQTRLWVRGDLRGRARSEAMAIARALHADITSRLLGPRGGHFGPPTPVDVCLLRSRATYDAFTRAAWGGAVSPRGFYSPSERVVVANMAAGAGNLRHEVVHALVGDDYPLVPAWLTEGLGALYGTSDAGPTGFRGRVNYRLRSLRSAIADGSVPTLDELAHSTAADLYGPRAATFYATARYVLLYLQERGRLEPFYRSVRDGEQSPAAFARALRAEVDWAELLRWAAGLRVAVRP